MTTQRMKKPGGDNDSDTAVLELGSVDVPDVSGQLQRLSEAADQAGEQKRTERQAKKQRDREREERYACCGIRI